MVVTSRSWVLKLHIKMAGRKGGLARMPLSWSSRSMFKYVNPLPKYLVGTSKCAVLHQEVKKISSREQLAIVIRHPKFMDGNSPIELYTQQKDGS